MKLSIEEKAKAYDEAFKRAREWYNELEPDSYTCVVESIFPEFKERSKNERIRKEIISILKGEVRYTSKEDTDRYIAWLEKKGETSEVDGTFVNIDDVREYFMQEIYRILDADPTNDRANQIIDVFDGLPTVKLEKQGEPNPYSGVSFKYNGHTWGMCARDNGVEILVDGEIKERVFLGSKPQGKSALDAINEEKVDNANKVEPKFHEGDWVVLTVGELSDTRQIVNVDTNKKRYWFDDNSYLPIVDEECLRLWTIQDAKDSDMLSWDDSKCITIFKNIYDKDSFNSYGFVGSCTGTFESRIAYHDIKGAHPATREQRDLLLTKMEEAGYEWDARKKELNKVERKEAIHKELTEFEKAVKQVMEEAIECGDTHNLKADADMLLSLVQKSDEEYNITGIHSRPAKGKLGEMIKNLKPAWSEEDENIIEDAACVILDCVNTAETEKEKKRLEELFDKLQDLKPQSTWKPSDEQIKCISDVVADAKYRNDISTNGYEPYTHLSTLLQQLKKLKEK